MAVVNYLRSLGYVFVCRRLPTNKKPTLRPLWFDLAHHPESIEGRLCGEQIFVRVSRRGSAANSS